MKKLKLIIMCGVTATVIFTGCSTSTPNMNVGVHSVTGKKFVVDNTLPGWVGNAQQGIEKGVAAVGQTNYSKYGDEIMVPEAELTAKVKLAAIMEEKLWGFQKSVAKKADIDLDEAYSKVFKSASKQVVKDVSLSGTISVSRYQSPVTGILYVRVMLPFKNFKDELVNSKKELKENYKKMGLTTQAAEAMIEGIEDEAETEWNR